MKGRYGKMKNKYIKIAITLFIVFIITISFCNNIILGFDASAWKPGEMTGGNDIKNFGNTIIGFLQIVGSLVSVIALIIIGVKYMMGSVEEKAEYKKTMLPYIIGAVMVFGISNIMAIIVDVAKVFD